MTDLYSFDHDLGHFVSIGPGTVSEDGSRIVSNPGVGIVKAGWHCGGNPAASGAAHDCPPCQICNGSTCVPGCSLGAGLTAPLPFGNLATSSISAPSCGCTDNDACTTGDSCTGGGCRGKPVSITKVVAKVNGEDQAVGAVGDPFSFSAVAETENCESLVFTWHFPDGGEAIGQSVTHSFSTAGLHSVMVSAKCSDCQNETSNSVIAAAVELTGLRVQSGASQSGVTGEENWASVRDFGYVVVKATVTPDVMEAGRLVSWSGGSSSSDNLLIRLFRKDSARKEDIRASLGSVSKDLKLWVLWTELEFHDTGATSPNNEAHFPSRYLNDNLGEFTDDADGLPEHETTGKVEIEVTLEPPGVGQVVTQGWDIKRGVSGPSCADGVYYPGPLQGDDQYNTDEDLSPSTSDRIYSIDGPGIKKGIAQSHEVWWNFYEYVEWNMKIVSDALLWHYHADIDKHRAGSDTVVNDVGRGEVTVPSHCSQNPPL